VRRTLLALPMQLPLSVSALMRAINVCSRSVVA
jgi:hypothetical protein